MLRRLSCSLSWWWSGFGVETAVGVLGGCGGVKGTACVDDAGGAAGWSSTWKTSAADMCLLLQRRRGRVEVSNSNGAQRPGQSQLWRRLEVSILRRHPDVLESG
jgi:hypothetical protein